MERTANTFFSRRRILWIAGFALMASLAIAVMMNVDTVPRPTGPVRTATITISVPPPTPEVRKMITELEGRSEHSSDPKDWVRLGQAYSATGRTGDAKSAYTKAYELAPDNPQVVAEYAWSLYSQDSHNARDPAHSVYQRLHQLDPGHPQALSYLGMAAVQRGDYRSALAHWEELLKTLPPGSPSADDVKRAISKTRALASTSTRDGTDSGGHAN